MGLLGKKQNKIQAALQSAADDLARNGVHPTRIPDPPPSEVLVNQVRDLHQAIDSTDDGSIAMVGIPATYLVVLVEEVLARRGGEAFGALLQGGADASKAPYDQDANVVPINGLNGRYL